MKNKENKKLKFVSNFLIVIRVQCVIDRRLRIYFSLFVYFVYLYIFCISVVAIGKKEVLCYASQLMANFVYVFYMHNTFVAMSRVLLYDTLNIYKFMYEI